MDECIIHMRQDAFLPVEGVGLAPHVPGLQGAPLPEKRLDSLHLGVAPCRWRVLCLLHVLQQQIAQGGHSSVLLCALLIWC